MKINYPLRKIKSVFSSPDKPKLIIIFILLYFSPFLIPYKILPQKLLIIYALFYYLGTMLLAEVIILKDRIKCFKLFKAKYIKKTFFILLESIILITITITFSCYSNILLGRQSNNENEIRQLSPIIQILLSVFYAPVVEETLYRYSLNRLINDKHLFIMISGLLFGFLHTISSIKSFSPSEFAVLTSPYIIVGIYLSFVYVLTNRSIELTLFNHRTLNLIACIPVIIAYLD